MVHAPSQVRTPACRIFGNSLIVTQLVQVGGRPVPWFGARKRCDCDGCASTCLGAGTSASFIIAAVTLACLSSFLSAVGVPINSSISTGFRFTWPAGAIIIVWALSIAFNVWRKHEDPLWCFIDSIGIPAVLLSFPEIVHLVTSTANKLGS